MSECPICYEAINKDTGISTLACSHSYHLKCIATWLSNNDSCPCCRKEVNRHEKLSELNNPAPATPTINIVGEEGYSESYDAYMAAWRAAALEPSPLAVEGEANVADTLIHLDATESMINRFLSEIAGAPRPPRDLARVNARWNLLNPEDEEDVVEALDSIIYGR